MAKETGIDPSVEKATQAGDLAMLFYSIGKLLLRYNNHA